MKTDRKKINGLSISSHRRSTVHADAENEPGHSITICSDWKSPLEIT